jgi:hypothetical protein
MGDMSKDMPAPEGRMSAPNPLALVDVRRLAN